MKCKVITLPSANERQTRIKENFNKFEVPFSFENGILREDCSFVRENNKDYIICKNFKMFFNEEKHLSTINRKFINFGEIGAYLAHYFIWKDFLNSNDDHIIICEDDAYLNNKILVEDLFTDNVHFINLQSVTAHYEDKKKWHRSPFVEIKLPLVKYSNKIIIPTMCEGLAAYAIDKVGAKILCDYIETNGYIGPNDWLISQLALEGILEIYSPFEIDKYFTLDKNTYEYSFTHTGEFKTDIKFKEIELRTKCK